MSAKLPGGRCKAFGFEKTAVVADTDCEHNSSKLCALFLALLAELCFAHGSLAVGPIGVGRLVVSHSMAGFACWSGGAHLSNLEEGN